MDSRWLVPIRLGFAGIILLTYGLIKLPKDIMLPWRTPKRALTMLVYGLLGGVVGGLVFRIWNIYYISNIYGIFGIAFVVVVGNILAFTLYIKGVQLIGPNKAILYSFAEPITAAIISSVVLDSAFTAYDAIGFILIFAMLCLISINNKRCIPSSTSEI